ncbi:membrane protein [Massilia sp. BSC265]|uniref:COG4648 family protein n=1 Tax=Massilia sp. BSC265 TaxID=1549812 RepID=UPI0004E88CB7|nr:membrane protein [Massilia sp. BSC265]KFI08180.1 membrane protein [Massilia sp. BSC265]
MFWNVLAAALTLAYPLAIWLGQDSVEPRWLAGLLLLAAATRVPMMRGSSAARWTAGGALVLVALAVASNAVLPLKLYPVLVNGALLAVFGASLVSGMPVAERLARLREPVLPPEGVAYTRRVTLAWCVFFVLNGALALGTALFATDAVWSLYNGVIAYILMALMFGGEYLLRMRFKRLHHA